MIEFVKCDERLQRYKTADEIGELNRTLNTKMDEDGFLLLSEVYYEIGLRIIDNIGKDFVYVKGSGWTSFLDIDSIELRMLCFNRYSQLRNEQLKKDYELADKAFENYKKRLKD